VFPNDRALDTHTTHTTQMPALSPAEAAFREAFAKRVAQRLIDDPVFRRETEEQYGPTAGFKKPAPVQRPPLYEATVSLKKDCLLDPERTVELLSCFFEKHVVPKAASCPAFLTSLFSRKIILLLRSDQDNPLVQECSEPIVITRTRFDLEPTLFRLYRTDAGSSRLSAPTTVCCDVFFPGGSVKNVVLSRLLAKQFDSQVISDATADVVETRQRLLDAPAASRDPYGAGPEAMDFDVFEFLDKDQADSYRRDMRAAAMEETRLKSQRPTPGARGMARSISDTQEVFRDVRAKRRREEVGASLSCCFWSFLLGYTWRAQTSKRIHTHTHTSKTHTHTHSLPRVRHSRRLCSGALADLGTLAATEEAQAAERKRGRKWRMQRLAESRRRCSGSSTRDIWLLVRTAIVSHIHACGPK
jgi:hypothetical protein